MTLLFALLLHQQTAPNQNNRYVKLTCMEGRLRLAYTILYGDLPAENERKKMDANGDGKIDDAEAHAYAEQLARLVSRTMTLEIDDQRVTPQFQTEDVGLGSDRGVHPVPFSVDLVASFAIVPPGGEHRVRYDDRFDPPRLGETEIVLEEAPGTRVTGSWTGKNGSGLHGLKWLWPGPRLSDLEDRSVGFTYSEPGGPARKPLRMRAAAIMGAMALVFGLLLGLVMLRKKRPPTSTT